MEYPLYCFKKSRLFFLVILISLFSIPITAQQDTGQLTKQLNPSIPYAFSSEITNFAYLNGGIVVPEIGAERLAKSGKLPLGFSFQFGCQTYSEVYAGSHGTLSFNNSFYSFFNSSNELKEPNLTLLAPLWDESGLKSGTFSYSTAGTAPRRVFTAEWKNWKWSRYADSGTISFQIKLYEGTNTIEYIYNKEPHNSDSGTKSASIGMFNGNASNPEAKQLWLDSSKENPLVSTTFVQNIDVHPASGQLYRFTRKDNEDSCRIVYYGRTIINVNHGRTAKDGLEIILSGAANMQVRKDNINQIYSPLNELSLGTSMPYGPPSSNHGILLSVGRTSFYGGGLRSSVSSGLNIISSTKQSDIEVSPGYFVNEIKLSAVKNNLTYYLTIKYTYNSPENGFLVDYNIIIPKGNTEEVKFSHGWDTYLKGSDKGPGFVSGSAPNLIVGVSNESSSYEAIEYMGGVPWSGYYSAVYNGMSTELRQPAMTFNNTIDKDSNTDNAIGISINFGKTPGSYTSSNKFVFGCETDQAPILSATGSICKGRVLDLNSLIKSGTPAGAVLIWKDSKGADVTNPTAVTVAGTYSAYYSSTKYNCISPGGTTIIKEDDTCEICYKPGVINGKEAGSQTFISTLNRDNNPKLKLSNGALILESKEKGFAISKIVSPEKDITVPVEGMLVFDITSNCLKLYNGSTWNCIQQACIDNKK